MGVGKVAIIMRTKDRPILLRRALASVAAQTDRDWVLAIVNDGGDPCPVEELLRESSASLKGRVHVIHNATSAGMEAASNQGIAATDSEYVVIHDDDDSWEPTFLESQTAFLEAHARHASVGGVVSGFKRVFESIEGDQVVLQHEEDVSHWRRELTLWQMCGANLYPPIAFLYRRAAGASVGPYREDLPVLGDWEFNIRFLRRFDVVRGPGVLANYHHRVSTNDRIYENTVTGGIDRHHLYGSMIRNEFLRQDLDRNQLGLGVIVNASRSGFDLLLPIEDIHREVQLVDETHRLALSFQADRMKLRSILKKLRLIKG